MDTSQPKVEASEIERKIYGGSPVSSAMAKRPKPVHRVHLHYIDVPPRRFDLELAAGVQKIYK